MEIREAIDYVLIDSGISPSNNDWNSGSLLCSLLKPFAVLMDILQGETLGCVSRYTSYLLQGTVIMYMLHLCVFEF